MAERRSVACVTGVSRGLGAALAAELLQRGWEVVGLGRRADAALAGPRFRLVVTDLADLGPLDGLARSTFEDLAALAPTRAVLVNNAAVAGPVGALGTLEARELADALAVNLAAPLLLANAFVRAFAGRCASRVIHVSSGLAVRALPAAGAYCVAKAGLEMAAAVGAAEAPQDVVTVVVRPGIVDTPMQSFLRSQPAARLPDVAIFADFHASGRLQTAQATARWLADRAVEGDVANGTVLSYPQ